MEYEEIETPPEPAPRSRPWERGSSQARPLPSLGGTFVQSCLVAGCVTVFVPVLITLGFFLMTYFLISRGMDESSRSSIDSLMPGSAAAGNIRERVIRPGKGDEAGTIAIITIQGGIDGNGSPLEGDGMLSYVSDQLRVAGEDKDVKAVLLQIDSPGGGLTASDLLYNEVLNLKKKKKKVLVWAGGVMASGGYYIAVGADGTMASPTCTVGSIGVIMRHFQVSELLKKIGVETSPIVSGDRKDIGSPFREMTPEERKLLQDYIDAAHSRFVDVVAEGRKMDREAVAGLADGGIFTAAAALENGLIDRIGYIEDALTWAEEESGRKNMRVVSYRRLVSLGDIFREAGRGAAGAALESAASAEPAPRAMAVWEGR